LPASEKGRRTPRVGWEGRKTKRRKRCCSDPCGALRPRYRRNIPAQRPYIQRCAAHGGKHDKHRGADEPRVLEEGCGAGGHAIMVVAPRARGVSGPTVPITVAISAQGR